MRPVDQSIYLSLEIYVYICQKRCPSTGSLSRVVNADWPVYSCSSTVQFSLSHSLTWTIQTRPLLSTIRWSNLGLSNNSRRITNVSSTCYSISIFNSWFNQHCRFTDRTRIKTSLPATRWPELPSGIITPSIWCANATDDLFGSRMKNPRVASSTCPRTFPSSVIRMD